MRLIRCLIIFSAFLFHLANANSQSLRLRQGDWARQKSTGRLMQVVGAYNQSQVSMKPMGENSFQVVSLSDLEWKPVLVETDVIYYNNVQSSVNFQFAKDYQTFTNFTASIIGLSNNHIEIRLPRAIRLQSYAVLPTTAVFATSLRSFKHLQVGDIAFWSYFNSYVWVDQIFSDGSVLVSPVLNHTSDAMARYVDYVRVLGNHLRIAKVSELQFESRNRVKGSNGEIVPSRCETLLK